MAELRDHKARSHALLSASSAERWLACPPSAVAAELYPQADTAYTREGTLAHEVAELYVRKRLAGEPVPSTLPDVRVTQEMIECAESYADYITSIRTDPDALVLLEQRVNFSLWVPDGFGTADCIIIQGDRMDVIDYKFGKGVAVNAAGNPQEKLYGLGALSDYGFAYDVETVRLHIYQPRMNNVSVDELTATELLAWAEHTVRPTADLARKGAGDYAAGEWCRFCGHAGLCPQLTAACTSVVMDGGEPREIRRLAPWEVAEALRLEPMIAGWLKRLKEQALSSLMAGEEIPGYKVVEGKLGNRRWTSEDEVIQELLAAGYGEHDITETKLLSPAEMDKAIGKKKVAELLSDLTERSPGAPTVVPESDKRPPLDRLAEAQKAFS